MNENQRRTIYTDAINKWGFNNQLFMVFEECGELLDALSKYNRGRVTKEAVITELADVSIMIEQMANFFGYEKFKGERNFKICRLKTRLYLEENYNVKE